jgi:hypothetical protein
LQPDFGVSNGKARSENRSREFLEQTTHRIQLTYQSELHMTTTSSSIQIRANILTEALHCRQEVTNNASKISKNQPMRAEDLRSKTTKYSTTPSGRETTYLRQIKTKEQGEQDPEQVG